MQGFLTFDNLIVVCYIKYMNFRHIVVTLTIFLMFGALAPMALGDSASRFIVSFKANVTQKQAEEFLQSTGFEWKPISMRGWEYVVQLPLTITEQRTGENPSTGIEIKPNPIFIIRHASVCRVIESWGRDPMKQRIEFCFGTAKTDADNIIKSFDLKVLSAFEPTYLVLVFVPFSADNNADKIPTILQESSLVQLVERDQVRNLASQKTATSTIGADIATSTIETDAATSVVKETDEQEFASFTDKFVGGKVLLAGGIFTFACLVVFVLRKRKR